MKKESSPANVNRVYSDPSSLFPYEHQWDIPAENPPQLEDSALWKQHKAIQPEFLEEHRDVVLCDILNRVKAFLLYPPHCRCETRCFCATRREEVILSLNSHTYNKIEGRKKKADLLFLRAFLQVPDEHFFRKNSGTLYPLWLIQEGLQKPETALHFKRIEHLMWILLRLATTYELSPFMDFQASVEKALEIILGKGPLKTGKKKQLKEKNQDEPFGGEKAYRESFKLYKSLSPFIIALSPMREKLTAMQEERSVKTPPDNPWDDPSTIEQFLKLAHFFRKHILRITTPNVKGQSLFLEETLFSLPPWVHSDDIEISFHPFEDKLQEMEDSFTQACEERKSSELLP